ncbi:hypothetical protein EON66_07510 [archaeon]|nr:MAG: hypothetical protein EON66_07510 [archaeon]
MHSSNDRLPPVTPANAAADAAPADISARLRWQIRGVTLRTIINGGIAIALAVADGVTINPSTPVCNASGRSMLDVYLILVTILMWMSFLMNLGVLRAMRRSPPQLRMATMLSRHLSALRWATLTIMVFGSYWIARTSSECKETSMYTAAVVLLVVQYSLLVLPYLLLLAIGLCLCCCPTIIIRLMIRLGVANVAPTLSRGGTDEAIQSLPETRSVCAPPYLPRECLRGGSRLVCARALLDSRTADLMHTCGWQ